MRNQDLHNDLGLLTEDQYRTTFEVTGDGSNFMGLSNSGAIARALVTFMHETGYLVEEMVRDDGDLVELLLVVEHALSEASGLELRQAIEPIRGPLEDLLNLASNDGLTPL